MNWLDIFLLIALGVFAFVGLRIGVIKAILLLLTLVMVITVAGRAYAFASQWLGGYISDPFWTNVLTSVLIVIAILFMVIVAALILKGMLALLLLGWFDRVGGAAVCLAAGAVLAGVLLAIASKSPFFDVAGATANSSVATVVLDRFPMILDFLSDQVGSLYSYFR
ncbi:MAG: CvpA family protein [Dehalococcoidia bacterium]